MLGWSHWGCPSSALQQGAQPGRARMLCTQAPSVTSPCPRTTLQSMLTHPVNYVTRIHSNHHTVHTTICSIRAVQWAASHIVVSAVVCLQQPQLRKVERNGIHNLPEISLFVDKQDRIIPSTVVNNKMLTLQYCCVCSFFVNCFALMSRKWCFVLIVDCFGCWKVSCWTGRRSCCIEILKVICFSNSRCVLHSNYIVTCLIFYNLKKLKQVLIIVWCTLCWRSCLLKAWTTSHPTLVVIVHYLGIQ